jgi:hypothetical protein
MGTISPPRGIFFWEAGGFSNQEGEKKLEKERQETREVWRNEKSQESKA